VTIHFVYATITEHAALAGGSDADRDERGHADHPASVSDLDVDRV